ncbi:hypothetical protein L1049_011373 [Liquidambar formosana]|uniref:Uncharacterized protein n=1 Tax=Liquidambar formosana TaxID=63359 RepID=A0AAP0RW64_LIQFO
MVSLVVCLMVVRSILQDAPCRHTLTMSAKCSTDRHKILFAVTSISFMTECLLVPCRVCITCNARLVVLAIILMTDPLHSVTTYGRTAEQLFIRKNRTAMNIDPSMIAEIRPLQKKFTDLKAQLELKSYDLSLFQNRAKQNEHHKLGELVKKIEQELGEAKSVAKEEQLLYENCVTTVLLLEKSIKEHANNRDGRLKDLEKKIKARKAQMQSASKELKGHENKRERLIMEMEAVVQERTSVEGQLASLRTQTDCLTSEVDEHKTKVTSIRDNHDQAQSELNLIHSKMKECDSQISCIVKEQQRLQHKLTETNLIQRKKLENEVVKQMEMEQKDCSLKVDKLIEKHAWIASEKQLFREMGQITILHPVSLLRREKNLKSCKLNNQGAGLIFCFDLVSSIVYFVSRAEIFLPTLTCSNLEKRVNKKVMAMFEKAADEYNGLISKKNIIENDKSKIKMVIEELDEKKETLKVTWVKVNNNFRSIFSTLLPGTMAKLEPPEGQSLSELSGGQ